MNARLGISFFFFFFPSATAEISVDNKISPVGSTWHSCR